MGDRASGQHDVTACARAWQTLRLAHDRVAQRLEAELAACALSLNEFDALLFLRMHWVESVRIGALQEAVMLSQPALSRLVSRLVDRGLLDRAVDEDDGRAIILRLTADGRALIDRAIGLHARAVHDALIGRLSETEQTNLLRVLSQIAG